MIADQQRKIKATLRKLGLTKSEVQVFFAGLERGAATIRQLAEDTRMGRITVHEIARRLIKKWLFLETYSGKKRLIYPNQVDALPQLIASKKAELARMEKEAEKAASLLRSFQLQSEHFPKTRFYKGKEGVEIVTNEIKQDKKDVSLMSDGQHFYDLIDNDFLEKSLDIRGKYKITMRLIFPTGFEYFTYTQGTYQQQLDIKSLPDQDMLKGWLTIRGNKVALHCYEGKFISTTILENERTTGIVSYLFEQLWKSAQAY